MQTHILRLHQEPFAKIKDGIKVVEARLFDDKRRTILVDDELEFTSRVTNEKIIAEVISLVQKSTFLELVEHYPAQDFGYADKNEISSIYEYYTKEDEKELGVIGIRFLLK